jgi:hypothetical protein
LGKSGAVTGPPKMQALHLLTSNPIKDVCCELVTAARRRAGAASRALASGRVAEQGETGEEVDTRN